MQVSVEIDHVARIAALPLACDRQYVRLRVRHRTHAHCVWRGTRGDIFRVAGLRIVAVGHDVAVRDSTLSHHWSAESGQMLMDFDVSAGKGLASVTVLDRKTADSAPALNAQHWFRQGEKLETTDRTRVEAAHREALRIDSKHGTCKRART